METENKAKWYVAHTYSGYENKVKANIKAAVETRGMHDIIQEIHVPMQEQVEIKNGKKKITMKKIFPGYVIIKMIMTDESWYVVRNTRGVTGFVGPGSKPVPLSDAELKSMGIQEQRPVLDIYVGDHVKVISGPFENFAGVIEEVNLDKTKIKVNISMFGRETPVELGFDQIEKM
ncbi:MAG TPA: transcription termination/antitermination protein NusG [Eubacteriaceae bacterium]|jgi:transcriptional antiterminator NusG|nr:transcription termination/antitermination protein NusG [Eubacteriaceae bacterium]